MRTYVVIPGFNEEIYIKEVLKGVSKITKNIVFVDDGSIDNTGQIAKKYSRFVLTHEVNLGKGAALKTGSEFVFKSLGADAVVFMDSDGQHNPKDLVHFFKKLKGGNSVIFGVRDLSPKMPFIRLIGNKLASFFLKMLFHQYFPDIPSGFKAMTKKAYYKLRWDCSGYEVETEIAARVAKKNIPFELLGIQTIYRDRIKGVSFLDGLNVLKFLVELRFRI